jgi:hypothetical protein
LARDVRLLYGRLRHIIDLANWSVVEAHPDTRANVQANRKVHRAQQRLVALIEAKGRERRRAVADQAPARARELHPAGDLSAETVLGLLG